MVNSRRYLNFRLILQALFAAAAGFAGQPPERRIEFTVFAAEPITDVAFCPRPGGTPIALRFYPTARSPSYSYVGPEPITFCDAATGEVVAEVLPPASLHRALFLFTPLAQPPPEGRRYVVQVLDDDLDIPRGMLVILNGSGLELSGVINGRAVTLRPGLNGPLCLGVTADVLLQTQFRGRLYQSLAETISLRAACRAVLILLPPYRAGSLEVQSRLLLNQPGDAD